MSLRLAAIALLLALALLAGMLWYRGQAISARADADQLRQAHAALSAVVDRLQDARVADQAAVLRSAQAVDRLEVKARALDHKLREAMHAEADFDRVLSRGVTDALCLRYSAASGKTGGDPACSAGCADAGKTHPPAAGCDAWAGLTIRDAVVWVGLLLDHAGAERLDKAALRSWAMGLRE